jgi:preprotein translocase subunit SecE
MNTKVDTQSDERLDPIKWLASVLLLVGAVFGFYYYEETSTLLRVLLLLVATGAALFVASLTVKGRQSRQFIRDTHLEVRKVVWPSRQETVQTTGIVIVMVLIIALMIWMVDSILFWIVQKLTG